MADLGGRCRSGTSDPEKDLRHAAYRVKHAAGRSQHHREPPWTPHRRRPAGRPQAHHPPGDPDGSAPTSAPTSTSARPRGTHRHRPPDRHPTIAAGRWEGGRHGRHVCVNPQCQDHPALDAAGIACSTVDITAVRPRLPSRLSGLRRPSSSRAPWSGPADRCKNIAAVAGRRRGPSSTERNCDQHGQAWTMTGTCQTRSPGQAAAGRPQATRPAGPVSPHPAGTTNTGKDAMAADRPGPSGQRRPVDIGLAAPTRPNDTEAASVPLHHRRVEGPPHRRTSDPTPLGPRCAALPVSWAAFQRHHPTESSPPCSAAAWPAAGSSAQRSRPSPCQPRRLPPSPPTSSAPPTAEFRAPSAHPGQHRRHRPLSSGAVGPCSETNRRTALTGAGHQLNGCRHLAIQLERTSPHPNHADRTFHEPLTAPRPRPVQAPGANRAPINRTWSARPPPRDNRPRRRWIIHRPAGPTHRGHNDHVVSAGPTNCADRPPPSIVPSF